jgi:electron transfer flavoprotein alpha/beta subunit
MKIVVCIKPVLDPRGMTVNRKAEKVFINQEDYVIDPASKAALEVAASLKAQNPAAHVIAMSVGTDRADDALREALARGADRAILIGLDNIDAWAVANSLSAAINRLGDIDLVLCGEQSLDTGAGELGPRLAENLDWPQITRAANVEALEEGFKAIVHHDGFITQTISAPAVISIMPEAFTGTFANGWRLMDAYKKIIVDIWRAEELGLSEDDLRTLTAKKEEAFPPERQPGTPVRNAKELVMMLKRERIIA